MVKKKRSSKLLYAVLIIALLLISALSYQFFSIFSSDIISFTYTDKYGADPLEIGDKSFVASGLQYICDFSGEEELSYRETKPECWKSSVSYNGAKYEFVAEKPVVINRFMTVTLTPNAYVYFTESYDPVIYAGWEAFYSFEINTDNLLSSSIRKVKHDTILNNDGVAIITTNNEIASFDDKHSGFWIRTSHSLLEHGESWETFKDNIYEGENSYIIPIDTTELGKVTQEIQPFVKIDADDVITIYQNKPTEISYEVFLKSKKDNLSDTDISNDQQSDEQLESWFSKIINFLFGWIR